jgi:hypothetical protein
MDTMKYLKERSAIDGVKQIFSNTSEDSVTVEEAAQAWDRNGFTDEQNARWLGNKMTHWKYHDLVRPVYKRRNSRRVFGKIQLTLKGKRAIGRIKSINKTRIKTSKSPETRNISLSEFMKLLPKLREENPEFDINFEVKLKNRE